jgi:hypothetical protein
MKYAVGAVVVLAQEVEVGAWPTDRAEADQVETIKGAAGKRGSPAKAILDGPRCIVLIYGADLLAGSVNDLDLSLSWAFTHGHPDGHVTKAQCSCVKRVYVLQSTKEAAEHPF